MASSSSTRERYDTVAMSLHWLTVLLVIALFALGWYMTDLPKDAPERGFYFPLHKSLGLTTALVVAGRLVWRLRHAAPVLPAALPGWQRRLATATHHLLYLALLLQPLTGYLSATFSGHDMHFWGIPLPQWGWRSPGLNEFFTEFHEFNAGFLLCLIGVHLCGALAFLVSLHDNYLYRMLPPGVASGSADPGATQRSASGDREPHS